MLILSHLLASPSTSRDNQKLFSYRESPSHIYASHTYIISHVSKKKIYIDIFLIFSSILARSVHATLFQRQFSIGRYPKFADEDQGYRPEPSRVVVPYPIDRPFRHKLLSIRPPVMTPTGAASRRVGLMPRDERVLRAVREGDREREGEHRRRWRWWRRRRRRLRRLTIMVGGVVDARELPPPLRSVSTPRFGLPSVISVTNRPRDRSHRQREARGERERTNERTNERRVRE